jgi:PAS domain S-box-containing protein
MILSKQRKEFLEKIKKLEKELDIYRAENHSGDEGSGNKLFKAFRSASYLMAISNSENGCIADINDQFVNALGYTRDEIIGRTADDLHLFADLEESSKYLRLISRLKKVKDYPVTLKTKKGELVQYLFSAETLLIDNELYLLTIFDETGGFKDRRIGESVGGVLDEIFETVTNYLALFSVGDDKRFYILDMNSKVEEVEYVSKNEVLGKCIDDTTLAKRTKLLELLQYVRITENAHKLAASPNGDDSEGYYMGFLLTSGNIIITWEPGNQQRNREDIHRLGIFFMKVAETLPEMIFEVDAAGKFIFVNHEMAGFFQYTREEFIHKLSLADIYPESYNEILKGFGNLKLPKHISEHELIARKKDGSLIPTETNSFASFLDDKIVGYRGLIKDISKKIEYESEIKKEKAFLENLIDSAPEAIAITDDSGRITVINKEFTKLFGYSPAEAINNLIDNLVVPADLVEEDSDRQLNSAPGNSEIRKTIRQDKYGNKVHVSLISSEIKLNDKVIAAVGIYRDISLERRNQLMQEILYNISTAALKQFPINDICPIIVNELGKLWDTKNFYLALYNRESDTFSFPFVTGRNDIFREKPAGRTINDWLLRNNKPALLKESDLIKLEKEGKIDLKGSKCKVWMGVHLKAENETIGIMCLQDYTDENKFLPEDLISLDFISNQVAIAIHLKIMFDNLITARQKAEEAAQNKQLFMSTMSHEIRTPLNEVIGITNLLLQGNPNAEQLDYLKTLKFSGNHLLSLVNDVLDYNKIESGKIVLEQTEFNLRDFLDELIRSYSFRSKAKNLSFIVNVSKNLPTEVIGDPVRLNQILSNLLSNALKFTHRGSITVSVTELKRTTAKSEIEFSVADTGIGISREKHSVIFESFTQAADHTTRQFGGTGLGLAICKKLVELQEGTIGLESEPGKGSTFRFTISLKLPETDVIKTSDKSPENYLGLEGKRILVAEDNRINFFVANKFLIGWGTIVTHAENGQIALDLLEKQEFDLILMDLHMPVLDGFEAIKIIRKSDNPRIREIPIVALTAAAMSDNIDGLEELNINDYVLKPFKPHDLFERLYKNIKAK